MHEPQAAVGDVELATGNENEEVAKWWKERVSRRSHTINESMNVAVKQASVVEIGVVGDGGREGKDGGWG